MPTYNTNVSRNTNLLPPKVAGDIIKALPEQSFMMSNARKVTLSSSTTRQPVLSVKPTAYWVSGDYGLKQSSSQEWSHVDLVPEELAVIIPISENYISDLRNGAGIDIIAEMKPEIAESLGRLVDQAAMWGVNKPASWTSNPIYQGCLQAGNYKVATADLAKDVADVNKLVAQDGFPVNGFASAPGFMWELVGLRSSGSGDPIFQPDLTGEPGGKLYGYPFREVLNGSFDTSEAKLIAGDWSKAIIGIREDISVKLFDQGVLADDSGNVVFSAMQSDAVALRVVLRIAFATANPVTALNSTSSRYPFGVLQATTANS